MLLRVDLSKIANEDEWFFFTCLVQSSMMSWKIIFHVLNPELKVIDLYKIFVTRLQI